MAPLIRLRTAVAACSAVGVFGLLQPVQAAMDSRFELDSQALERIATPASAASRADKSVPQSRTAVTSRSSRSGATTHVVKAGDNLFKILMHTYGLSNREAEQLLEEVRRVNNIPDIRRLKIGQKIIIPAFQRGSARKQQLASPASVPHISSRKAALPAQTLHIEAPVTAASDQEVVEQVRSVWDKLVPARGEVARPLNVQSASFSLTLDPQRFPMFAAHDGGRIVVDRKGAIPALVKSLISESDPSVRIVSETSPDARRFLSSMLAASGFYSVEEGFSLEFGTDPALTVRTDFKIEKSRDSLIKQDVVLLNSGPNAMPASLGKFLRKEGFTLLEPLAQRRPTIVQVPPRQIRQVATADQAHMVDTVLKSLGVEYQENRRVDVFGAAGNGISLSVKAERYFERNAKRFVVTSFTGDPVAYTLFRLLETSGCRVVILERQDDFRRVTEKILHTLQIPGHYAFQSMWPDSGATYSLRMSGFSLEGNGVPGGALFLTDRPLDRIVRDLLQENGYEIAPR